VESILPGWIWSASPGKRLWQVSLLDAMTYALYGQARRRDEAIIHHASQKAESA
jgi:hypothetical protein